MATIYYGKTRHRKKIEFTLALRQELNQTVLEMHSYWQRKYTPRVKPSQKCKSCSLRDICLPELLNRESVNEYIERRLSE